MRLRDSKNDRRDAENAKIAEGVPLILYFSLRPLRSLRLCGEFFPNLELGIYVECKRAS